MANLFSKKIKGEEHRTQLQTVVFDSEEDVSIGALKKSQLDDYDELESYKKLRKKRKKIAWVRLGVWFLILLLTPIFVFFSLIIINPKAGHSFFGYNVYWVTSTSMVGVFDQGDCIIVKSINSREELGVGVDITFVRKSDGETVTHRIIDIVENDAGEEEYVTKGVNNQSADSETVVFENILGVRIKTVVWFGDVIEFFRTPYGIIVFLAIFVLIITSFSISFRLSDDIRAVGGK